MEAVDDAVRIAQLDATQLDVLPRRDVDDAELRAVRLRRGASSGGATGAAAEP